MSINYFIILKIIFLAIGKYCSRISLTKKTALFFVISFRYIKATSILNKPGGLDVKTNRDRDRERPSCRDQFLKLVEIFSTVEINFYFITVEIFKIETFQSRLGCVEIFIEIVEINRDCRDKSRPIETNQDICKKLRFCWDKSRFCRDKSRFVETFRKKIEFPALFAHFEANFEAQNVNK